jgi:hypothetical protein
MDTTGFPQLEVQRKSGAEPFWSHGQPLPTTLLDFWQWAVSDLVSNVTRGVLAEYIVAMALGRAEGIRTPWEAFDLLTSTGRRVEVKSASYLQSWYHKALSRIVFTIRPTRAWTAETNAWAIESQRQAEVYVFCILAHQEKASLDPLNLDQWTFWVLPSAALNEKVGIQKTLSLSALLKLHPVSATYEALASTIEQMAHGAQRTT